MPDGKDNFPCTKFEMDVTASFEACGTCGWTKPEHKAMTRKKLKRAFENKKAGTVITTQKVNRRDAEPCERFERDLARVEYEVCVCGWTPLEHEEAKKERELKRLKAALDAEREKNSINFREQAKMDGVPCTDFELDVNNDVGGYGVCLCGSRREDHADFHFKADEYKNKKEELTAPKPFQ